MGSRQQANVVNETIGDNKAEKLFGKKSGHALTKFYWRLDVLCTRIQQMGYVE